MSKTIISNDNAGTVIAPESQGTVVAPSQQGTVVAPMNQGTVVAPAGTTVAPSGTVVASGGTVVAGAGAGIPATQGATAGASPKKGAKVNFRMQPGEQIMLSGKAYTIVKGVSSGTEAELYVVNDGGADYAAKIYNRGFSPNAKILPDVMSIKDDDFIVHIYQSGIADIAGEPLSYVLMDYCEYGATSNYSYKNNVGELLEIALQGAMALDTCHKNHILHKDIKPANILVKKRGPIEICLCDFGIADKLDKKEISTSQSRTVIYAAPEMYTTGMVIDGRTYCKLSAASDFYALGMSLLSLWVGEAKFNASEIDLAYQKKEGSLVIPRDMPATLANIVKGLTNPEPSKRWGLNEIDRELTDVLLNINQTGDSQGILYDVSNNIIIKDLEDLANYLQTHTGSAKRLLYRGKLSALLKSSYPELSQDLTNIVETKYTSDQASGLAAAVFAINPNVAINLKGMKNDTGRGESKALNTIKEVSDFCCSHRELNKDSKLFLLSDTFVSWLRARDANVARAVSSLSRLSGESDYNREFNYRLIIQTIDPFADFNLCNDINDPHYAMTGAGIAWYINEAFNLYFSGEKSSSAQLSKLMVELLVKSFDKQMTTHKTSYLINSLKTKGRRFDDQIKWINYCTDTEPEVGLKYMPEVAMMKAVAGLGKTPEYKFYDSGKTISSLDEFHNIPQSDLKSHLGKGLIGWLAVQYQENPNLNIDDKNKYIKQLNEFYRAIGVYVDDKYPQYVSLKKVEFKQHLLKDKLDINTLAKELNDNADYAIDLIDDRTIENLVRACDPHKADLIAQTVKKHSSKDGICLHDKACLATIVFILNPDVEIEVSGKENYSGIEEKIASNKCNTILGFFKTHHELSEKTKDYLRSDAFEIWLEDKDKEAAKRVKHIPRFTIQKNCVDGKDIVARLIICAMDPSLDMLLNDKDSAYYCKDSIGLGNVLNEVFNVYYSFFYCNEQKMYDNWKSEDNTLAKFISPYDVKLILHSFEKLEDNSFILSALEFHKMEPSIQSIKAALQRNKEVDIPISESTLLLKAAAALGKDVEYKTYPTNTCITTLEQLRNLPKSVILHPVREDLKSWLAVRTYENPEISIENRKDFLTNLYKYHYCIGEINLDDPQYQSIRKKEEELYNSAVTAAKYKSKYNLIQSISSFELIFCSVVTLIMGLLGLVFDTLSYEFSRPFHGSFWYTYDFESKLYIFIYMLLVTLAFCNIIIFGIIKGKKVNELKTYTEEYLQYEPLKHIYNFKNNIIEKNSKSMPIGRIFKLFKVGSLMTIVVLTAQIYICAYVGSLFTVTNIIVLSLLILVACVIFKRKTDANK